MSLKNVGAVERFFCRRARPRAESANHGTLVMGEGVSILVVLASEAFDVVVASLNRALLWSLILVSQHVCFQVFEDLSALGISASSLLF